MIPELEPFLQVDEFIDWHDPAIAAIARDLAGNSTSDAEIASKCFIWVRDEIKHCLDFKLETMTCSASEVLRFRTGFCFAKSHLLAALLRANRIPSGLCYQRLSLSDNGAPYCLHGLNVVYLQNFGWYRVDSRGNRRDIDARFCPPEEKLAFAVDNLHTYDIPGIFASPWSIITSFLRGHDSVSAAMAYLPDDPGVEAAQ